MTQPALARNASPQEEQCIDLCALGRGRRLVRPLAHEAVAGASTLIAAMARTVADATGVPAGRRVNGSVQAVSGGWC
jgi:hypothetical protein